MELEINKKTMWSRYVFIFLLRICEFFIVVIIFGIVIQTKSRKNSVEDVSTVQLGTFAEEVTMNDGIRTGRKQYSV